MNDLIFEQLKAHPNFVEQPANPEGDKESDKESDEQNEHRHELADEPDLYAEYDDSTERHGTDEVDEEELLEDRYYDQFQLDDGSRRQDKLRQKNVRPYVAKQTAQSEFVDEAGLEDTFETSYTPARFEKIWLKDSLQTFYLEGIITDVLMLVKGGKEANVYLCQAHPSTGYELLAAKVYRPQQFRNLRNDSTYREGREILDGERGGVVEKRDSREMRALKKKTAFGSQMLHQSWLGYEYNTLAKIHGLGAAVPKPVSMGENAIVMEYVGDRQMAAPILGSVTLDAGKVEPLFAEVIRNIEIMLTSELIHGDLSGYNILHWNDGIALIDFPQVTSALSNRNAFRIFLRDVTRVCEYFESQGKATNAEKLARDLWKRCIGLPPERQIWDQ